MSKSETSEKAFNRWVNVSSIFEMKLNLFISKEEQNRINKKIDRFYQEIFS